MCGIVAIVGRSKAFPSDALLRATQSLRHRGPDGMKVWHAGCVGLGHTRLSIIDLATGIQPIANEDSSCRIVVNGEFYDYERYQRELIGRGHRLRTQSDSEIALHLYEERGVACLDQLRGEFAFAIWDEPNGALFAARDRFGIKPLFYTESDGVLLIASEVKALFAAGVRLSWDHQSVELNLFAGLVGRRTLFHGVHQVPPGHYLIATGDSIRVVSYWDLNYPRENDHCAKWTEGEWIEQLRLRTKEAVSLRLRADVPVGCLLSGGLDSSAALGIAREFTSGPLNAFTIAFDHPTYDESPIARDTAARMGADFQSIRVTNDDFAAVFSDAVWHAESLCYNAHAAARFLLSRAVKDAGVKVVLAGEGADELSAGYKFCRQALGVESSFLHWPPEALRLLGLKLPSSETIAAVAPLLTDMVRLLGFPKTFFDHRAGQVAVEQGLLASQFVPTRLGQHPDYSFLRQFDVAGQVDGREPIKQVLYFWIKSSFANYILCGERLDMAFGVEQRLPFLDHKLFEFVRDIPSSLLMREGREKWVLREAMKPFVSEQVYSGVKRPFFAPPSILQEGSAMLELAQDKLRSGSMAAVPFFDHRKVIGFLDHVGSLKPSDRGVFDSSILLMLSFCILHERYRM